MNSLRIVALLCLIHVLSGGSSFSQSDSLNSLNKITSKYSINPPDSSNLPSVQLFDSSNKKLSIDFRKLKDSLQNVKSNLLKQAKPKKRKVEMHGSLSNQFDYGAIPYYMADRSLPTSLLKSTGTLKARFAKLPLIADYFYANPSFISGLNNYYNIRFDVDEFRNIVNTENLNKTKNLKLGIDSLTQLNGKLNQQLALMQAQKMGILQSKVPKASKLDHDLQIPDSLSDLEKQEYFKKMQKITAEDSLANIYAKVDTSALAFSTLQDQIARNEQKIRDLKENVSVLEDPTKAMKDPSKMVNRPGYEILTGIKKLEIGMCYPSYSTFMLNQIAMKGINSKYEYKNMFFNTSAGKTIYNYSIQPTTSSILNQVQNLNSLFDWNSNPNEKKIVALKVGVGKESKNYIGVGGLFGRGTMSPASSIIKQNYVLEVDGRLIYKFLTFEASVAKSFLPENNKAINAELPSNSLNANTNRGIQVKVFGTIPKARTKVTLSVRQIDPFFKSFGVSFMRSDIRRYEGKLEQPIGKFVKVGFNYRRDEDNLSKLYSIYTNLSTYTYYGKIKFFKKRLDLTGNYTLIEQFIDDRNAVHAKYIKSDIKTIIATYTPRLRKMISTNTIVYNLYMLNDGITKNSLENISLNSFNSVGKWQLNILSALNRSTITDSLNFTNALNSSLEMGYAFNEKVKVLAGGKHAYVIPLQKSEFGYSGSIALNFHKLFNIEVKFEKLVIGDYINTLNYKYIQIHPYYGYINLISRF